MPLHPTRLLRLLAISLRSLLAHRSRSLLAVLGVAVGVAAVQLVTAIGEGARAELVAGLDAQGTRLLVIRPAQVRRLVSRKDVQGRAATLLPSDAEALAGLGPVEGVAPAVDAPFRIRSATAASRSLVLGTSPAFLQVRGFRLERGAFFSPAQDAASERVAVLGARVRATLFPQEDPVGRTVRIDGVPFEVIGALAAQGVTADGADVDVQVYVPLRTALRRLLNTRALGLVFVRLREGEPSGRAGAAIGALLRERHRLDERDRPDDFTIQDPARANDAKRKVVGAITALVAGLAAVSLGVGGTGILALMLLSVRERTPEIGLRRAVGARGRDVLFQFLAEAAALSAAGGVLGAALGVVGAWVTAASTGWPIRVPSWAALAGVAVSAGIGLVFGAWPARQAARLPPSAALSSS